MQCTATPLCNAGSTVFKMTLMHCAMIIIADDSVRMMLFADLAEAAQVRQRSHQHVRLRVVRVELMICLIAQQ